MATQMNKASKTVFYGVAIGLPLGFAISWITWFSSDKSVDSAPLILGKTTVARQVQESDLSQKLDLLYQKNAQLEVQQQEMASKIAEFQEKYLQSMEDLQRTVQQSTISQVQDTEYNAEEPSKPPQTVADIAQTNETATQQRISTFDNAMTEQDRDPSWSDLAVKQITVSISSGQFQGSSLVATECKATLCFVEVSHDSYPDMQKYLDEFPAALGWSDSSGQFEILQSDGEFLTRIYLSRSGYDLPPDAKAGNS